MNDLKNIVAKNISQNRKRLGLTQIELAEKINFSDKSISKWERGDGTPDLETMVQMAKFFGTSLDSLVSEQPNQPVVNIHKKVSRNSKIFIPVLSAGLVWLVGVLLFVILEILPYQMPAWLCFIYIIPVSSIVLIVFSAIWWKYLYTMILVSILCWTLTLALFLTFQFSQSWLLFIACIPLQVLIILWYIFKSLRKTKNN